MFLLTSRCCYWWEARWADAELPTAYLLCTLLSPEVAALGPLEWWCTIHYWSKTEPSLKWLNSRIRRKENVFHLENLSENLIALKTFINDSEERSIRTKCVANRTWFDLISRRLQVDFKSRDENNKKVVLQTFPLTGEKVSRSRTRKRSQMLTNMNLQEKLIDCGLPSGAELRCMLLQKLYWQLTFVDTRSEMSSEARKRFFLFAQLYRLTNYWKNVLSDICRAPVTDWKQVGHFNC